MGYTHYFEHRRVSKGIWGLICKDVTKLFNNLPKDVQLSDDSNHPDSEVAKEAGEVVLSGAIWFNGYPDPHETFCLHSLGSNGFEFCKTAHKPYDLMVCACLIAYNFHSSETIDISSDGGWDDWQYAMEFVRRVLGADRVMKFKMDVNL